MSIRKHILSALIFVLALTFVSFGTSIYYLQRIGSTSTQILQEDYQTVKAAEELIISLAKIDRALFMFCLDSVASTEEAVLKKVIRSEKEVALGYLAIIQKNTQNSDADSLYQSLETSRQQYERNLNQVATASDRGELYLSLLRWQNEIFRSSCSKIVDYSHQQLKKKNQSLQNLYLKAKINTFLASILVLLAVAVVMDKIPDRVIRPISELTNKVNQLVQGKGSATEKDLALTDNTDLKELASSINLAGQRLKETEEKFWLITENLYDIIFFCTSNEKIFYTTPSIERVLGYDPDEMIGQGVKALLHPKDAARLGQGIQAPTEIQVKTKEGEYLWLEVNQTLHQSEAGETLYAQYTARDINERKKAEERIKQALISEKALNDELTKANDELDKLVYSASHNLRSPLTSIFGLVSLLRLATRKAERTDLINQVEVSAYKLDETVKDIIEYSRNTRIAIEVALIDFEELIVEAIRDLHYLQPEERPVTISYEIAPNLRCYSDTKRAKIIFLSIISNAIKYHDAEKTVLTLHIAVTRKGKKTVATFTDNGIGIEDHLQAKVFDMFYRASEQTGGAGLGLYIARSTSEKIGGTLSLQSKLGEGTTITVAIPNLKLEKLSEEKSDQFVSPTKPESVDEPSPES